MKTQNKILTLLIPTYNRAKHLDNTLDLLHKAINYNKSYIKHKVDIIVIDNHSKDDTKQICNKWKKDISLKYYKQPYKTVCGEDSLINGLKLVKTEYVWTLGDDDFPKENCLDHLIDLLIFYKADYYCLNMNSYIPETKEAKLLIDVNAKTLSYPLGKDLFKDFGFCHLTCAFYSSVFKVNKFNIKLFEQIKRISPVYSFVFALWGSFHLKKSVFVNEPLVIGRTNKPENEFKGISKIYIDKGLNPYYAWGEGLLKIITYLSKKTKYPITYFLTCNEFVVNKSDWSVIPMSFAGFIKSSYESFKFPLSKKHISLIERAYNLHRFPNPRKYEPRIICASYPKYIYSHSRIIIFTPKKFSPYLKNTIIKINFYKFGKIGEISYKIIRKIYYKINQ